MQNFEHHYGVEAIITYTLQKKEQRGTISFGIFSVIGIFHLGSQREKKDHNKYNSGISQNLTQQQHPNTLLMISLITEVTEILMYKRSLPAADGLGNDKY